MSIANLANIPADEPSLLRWTFAHMDHHRLINQAIQRQHKLNLQTYPIDPITPLNMGAFLYQHQTMHTAMTQIFKQAGQLVNPFDLLDVDWRDDNQRATWIFQNFSEHLQAARNLGIE